MQPDLARTLAFNILMEVDRGGYASDLLAARTVQMDPREAGLGGAIVMGTLRRRGQIDAEIERLSGRTIAKVDREVLTALRIGVFQLLFLDRVPAHAAVDTSVELVKRAKKRSATGFVNAILRKVKPVREGGNVACPEWMTARWKRFFGDEIAGGVARASLETPERFIRVPAGAAPPEGAEPTEISGCYRFPRGETGFRVQDIGSQSIVPLLDLQPGNRFLDLCAPPGNKTAQACELPVQAIACDISAKRLQGMAGVRVLLDAEKPLPFGPIFDRILVDAPCSGTGTLGHNPEIKWRLTEAEVERQAVRQTRILENALRVLIPGGLLVYSTCSLEPEENEEVVNRVAGDRILRTVRRFPGREAGDGFFAALFG